MVKEKIQKFVILNGKNTVLFLYFLIISFFSYSLELIKGQESITIRRFSVISFDFSNGELKLTIHYDEGSPKLEEGIKRFVYEQEKGILKIKFDKKVKSVNFISEKEIKISFSEDLGSTKELFYVKDPPAYPIGPGDRLQVEIYGIEDMSKEVVVDPQGFITLPLVERVKVKDLSIDALQKLLEEKYSEFINEPQINLQLREYGSRFVNIIGEVEHPGRIALKKALRLLDAISEAGGFTPKSGDIEVQRRGVDGNIVKIVISKEDLLGGGDNEINFYVFDQDTINVLPIASVYVSGQVKGPKSIEYTRDLTLLKAIALAGGFTEWANKDKIIILRQKENGDTETLRVDASKIEKGKEKDVPLKPNDHIIVYERKLF